MSIVLHITRKAEWEAALTSGSYTADSLKTQGFIHCSTPAQVVPVANSLLAGEKDLVLLCIETDRAEAEIRYENLEGGEKLFPHIYGAIETDWVVSVCDFPPRDDGTFELPPALASPEIGGRRGCTWACSLVYWLQRCSSSARTRA